jgi:hypothetical protein
MSARVVFNTETALGELAAEAVDGVLEARAKLRRVVEAANAMIYNESGPADMAQLETEFGILNGGGQRFFDVLNGTLTALDNPAVDTLREIDQG